MLQDGAIPAVGLRNAGEKGELYQGSLSSWRPSRVCFGFRRLLHGLHTKPFKSSLLIKIPGARLLLVHLPRP